MAEKLVGQSFIDFEYEITGAEGKDHSIKSLVEKHEFVVLDCYTAWCKACPETAKKISTLAEENKECDVKFCLFNLENSHEDANEFFLKHHLNKELLISGVVDDESAGIEAYAIQGIPHKCVIQKGKIVANGSRVDLKTFDFSGAAIEDEVSTVAATEDESETPVAKVESKEPMSVTAMVDSYKNTDREWRGSRVSKEFKGYEKEEFILKENPNRWTMFPIEHDRVWEMYKQHEASFWTAEEIDLTQDMVDWEKLNDNEKHFLKHVLAFFAGSDGLVLENLSTNFTDEVQLSEARAFYGFQMAMENIHSETYSLLIDQYCRNDEAEKMRLFHAIGTIPCVQKKAEWAAKWMNGDLSFAERLVAFASVEGILFSGSFCAIYWVKKRGLMPGLTFSNELIARDEGLHTDFACLLYSMLDKKLPQEIVHEIIVGAVNVEIEFICEALSCDLIGMNKRMMQTYVEFVADRLLGVLGYEKIYKVKNPFDWMELISLQGKTNFFEKRVGDYQKAGLMAKTEDSKADIHAFTMDEDF